MAFGARGAGAGSAQDPDDLSVLSVPDLGATAGKDLGGLLDLAEPAIREHNWGVFCFHGVGGEYLSVSALAFDELAEYLDAHREIWTAPFGDVVRHIQERKSAVIRIHENSGGSFEVNLDWPLDSRIYDLPLTLKVEAMGGTKQVTATAEGEKLPVKIVKQKDTAIALVDVPSNTRVIHIMRSAY